jgi:GDP-4-dehydro-6-deoxy-D-mannose reductase
MKKAFITGITGFVGSHLAKYLADSTDFSITGTYLSEGNLKNVAEIEKKISLIKCDLNDTEAVEKIISFEKPEYIFHLAALPSPAKSFKDPGGYLQNNTNAQLHILEAVRKLQLDQTRILVVTSSEMYGMVEPEDIPMDEETPLRPTSPYGVSKITQDFLALQYHLAYKMDIVRVRPFGHIGPRLSDDFASSAFAKKIAEIEVGKRDPVLPVGNLEGKRDLTDVRDMVRAYLLLMEKGESGEVYNAGSGISYKTEDVLNTLLSFSTKSITVEQDEALFRPTDIPELRCDNTKLTERTGWKPEIKLDESLKDTLEYWRGIV